MEQEIITNFCKFMFDEGFATIQFEDGEYFVNFDEDIVSGFLNEYADDSGIFDQEESASVQAYHEYWSKGF